jgi:hypothetical protein
MEEISSSGSGEGPGRVTFRPTLQRPFHAAPPAAPAPEPAPPPPGRRAPRAPPGCRPRQRAGGVRSGRTAGEGDDCKGVLHALRRRFYTRLGKFLAQKEKPAKMSA